ncbi:Hypothetical protein SLIV_28417 [Streptomyces lividans TK24]|uniref:Secreted protein n=1 Tax=Streptomyces lividans TK24 TaxID=457428 RepID=A0ABX6TPT3_STRLI|nr:Hypothetical protein SLIV_28417 [Streptomyces lividans TK24]QSJ12183.1 Hypothetical protein SLIVDG2_28417 [Streptomyces lividans]QTD73093.1 Hypothetical protein SLIVYQS_28417 [Streptomyces lividans TK24] [Streptomyces lividans]
MRVRGRTVLWCPRGARRVPGPGPGGRGRAGAGPVWRGAVRLAVGIHPGRVGTVVPAGAGGGPVCRWCRA